MIHALGSCTVCENGELVFRVLAGTDRIIVECLECLSGYSDPLDLQRSTLLRMEDVFARPASHREVDDAGYGSLVAV
ncbi:MAG TPA: hypothetical protein VGK17_09705 [Propionicimonas sp.]|jgi:hypothetical protein